MELCAPGETIPAFLKRRDALMQASAQFLNEAGYRRESFFGTYTLNGKCGVYPEVEAHAFLEEAIAGLGPYSRGQIPGAFFYRTGPDTVDFTKVKAARQDLGLAMAHYAVIALFNGLNEQSFFKRFGVSLDRPCGEGLRYLQQAGLVAFSKGTWKFSGKWEVRRIREMVALSRVLFAEDLLLGLRRRFIGRYDPRQDYSGGYSLLNAYANNWLMALYYQDHGKYSNDRN